MNQYNNFKYGLTLANSLYDLDMNVDDYEELALIAWNFIGNKRCRLYKFTTNINCKDKSIQLPCNADIVEAVTYGFEDWKYTTNDTVNGDINSAFVESYIESRKLFSHPLYMHGKYAHYERVGDTLYFDKDYGKVNILYKGIIVDDEGLPEITDKEAMAIATYCAYTKKFKEGIKTNNPTIIQLSQVLKHKWNKFVDAARVPEYLNQNDMNEILDIGTRYDRKIYNKKYTPVL